jgi:hypothetical protein
MVNEVLEKLIYFVMSGYTMGHTTYTSYYCTGSKLLDSAYLMPDQFVYKFSLAEIYSTQRKKCHTNLAYNSA